MWDIIAHVDKILHLAVFVAILRLTDIRAVLVTPSQDSSPARSTYIRSPWLVS